MATQLGALVLDVVARVGGFTQGMSQAQRSASQAGNSISGSMEGAGSSIESASGRVDNFKTALGGIAAVAAASLASVTALYAIAGAAGEADAQILIMSDRTSTSIENFQRFTESAKIMGVEQEQAASILSDFQEKLGEFTSSEAGGASDFFEVLAANTKLTEDQIRNLARTMSGKDGVEAIQILKNNLDDLGASTQEQRFVMESFASDLGNLAPLFAENGKFMQEYGDQLVEYGVIKTDEAVQMGADYAAVQKDIQNQLTGVKNQIITGLTPAMSNMTNEVVNSVSNFMTMDTAMSIVGVGAKTLVTIFKVVMTVIRSVATAVGLVFKQIQTLGEGAAEIVMADGFMGKMRAASNVVNRLGDNYAGALKDVGADIGKTIVDIDSTWRKDYNQLDKTMNDGAKILADQTRNLGKSRKGSGVGTSVKEAEAAKSGASSAKTASDKARKYELKAIADYQKQKDRLIKSYMTEDELASSSHNELLAQLKQFGLSKQYDIELNHYNKLKELKDLELKLDTQGYKMSADEIAKIEGEISKLKIQSDKKMSEDEKNTRLNSLDDQLSQEANLRELERRKELDDHSNHLNQIKSMNQMMALEGQSEYSLGAQLGIEDLNYSDRTSDVNSQIKGLNDEAELGGVSPERLAKIQEELALHYETLNLMQEEHVNRKKEIEDAYNAESLDAYAQVTDGMMSLMSGLGLENSKAYKAMFLVQKAFALASVMLSAKKSIAEAWASNAFPYNLPAVAQAVANSGILQAGIQAIAPQGMAHSGLDYIPQEGTWLLDKGERVLSPRQNSDLTGFLNNQRQAVAQQASPSLKQDVKIINNLDPDMVDSYMRSPQGEKLILNTIKSNPTTIKRTVGA